MIVYTANFGNKDKLKIPLVDSSWDSKLKFFYFTDQEFPESIWETVIEKKPEDTTRTARWYKTHSHTLFPNETTLWIDANVTVIKDPSDLVDSCSQILTQEHPYRECLYEEVEYCLEINRGNAEEINKQETFYKSHNYPALFGLYSTRMVLRKSSSEITKLNEQWWEQIETFSSRDQISLPYVLWKCDIVCETISPEAFFTYFHKRGGHLWR